MSNTHNHAGSGALKIMRWDVEQLRCVHYDVLDIILPVYTERIVRDDSQRDLHEFQRRSSISSSCLSGVRSLLSV